MSFKAHIQGIIIECETVDDLDAVLMRFGVTVRASKRTSRPVDSEAGPLSETPVDAPPRLSDYEKNLSEKTYIRHSWKLVRILLKDENLAVGKLTKSLQDELHIKPYMLRRILDKMCAEENFISLTAKKPGQAPFVRITDRVAAATFVDVTKEKARALVQEELGNVEEFA